MKLKVFHTLCGGQIGWSEGGEYFTSEDFTFMDGTHPEPNAEVEFYCKTCEAVIKPQNPCEIEREFLTKE
jgi:hypothetical protein